MKSKATNIISIVIAGTIATTAMTVFSHAISKRHKKNFSEPILLGALLEDALPNTNERLTEVGGWVLHYMVGISFSAAYSLCSRLLQQRPALLKGFVFGVLSGGIAIGIWKLAFMLDDRLNKARDDDYFIQLFLAHIVFGVAVSETQ